MKRSELVFAFLQIIVDFGAVLVAAAVAYQLRDSTAVQEIILKPAIYNYNFREFMEIALWASLFVVIIFTFEGLYKLRVTRKIHREITLVAKSTSIAFVFVIVGFFLQREWFSSRFILVAAWFLAIVFVMLGRLAIRALQKTALKYGGYGQYRVLLIGSGQKLQHICRVIQRKPTLGYRIVKHIDHINIKRIKKIRQRFGVDEVIVNEPEMPDDLIKKLYDYCQINGIVYKQIPTSRQTAQFKLGFFQGEPIISYEHTPLDGWGAVWKRAFDIIGSLFLIVITGPIMLVCALLIKLEDPSGPLVFRNARLGAEGKEFFLYKLRYMKWEYCTSRKNPDYQKALAFEKKLIAENSERVGPIYKIINDPRKLKIGSMLERFSIDEFPQFFNVLKGEMSLVGPRPHQEREINNYRTYHRRLLTIKPGITGMAQVSGRSDLDFEDEYKLDVFYIENWSVVLDLIVILKTVPAVLKRRK